MAESKRYHRIVLDKADPYLSAHIPVKKLFCSHGTGGLASSVRDITDALPNSFVETNVIGIEREDIPDAQNHIKEWLQEIGY